MAYVNLQLPEEQLKRTSDLARQVGLNRAAYIRRAVERFNEETERGLLSKQYARSSALCRKVSLKTCREFEAAVSLHGEPKSDFVLHSIGPEGTDQGRQS